MDRRRSLLLLLVLALAALGIVLALLPAAEPGRPVDVAPAPATEDAGDLPAPAAPGVDGEEPATDDQGGRQRIVEVDVTLPGPIEVRLP